MAYPMSNYTFVAYDVLQIQRDGKWLDFSTLRTQTEADMATRMVDTGKWDGESGMSFRIVRFAIGKGKVPVYERQQDNASQLQCSYRTLVQEGRKLATLGERCTDDATAILEYELDGKASDTHYLCRHHATREAERILALGGSPRLGNV